METSSTKRQQLVTPMETLTSTSLPTLPFDLVAHIFSRLPVKLLLQLRCLSKSFNSLISHSNFAKEHLNSSINRHHLMLSSTNNLTELLLFDSPISSLLSTSTLTQTQLNYPITPKNFKYGPPFGFSSCDGILCFSIDESSAVLWNPSIRKFKLLPPLKSSKKTFSFSMYSFGYHHLRNSYKTIAISFCVENKTEVSVNTMGTDCWRRLKDFPCYCYIYGSGVFLRDTVHWLTHAYGSSSLCAIVFLDLEKESYRKLYMYDLKQFNCNLGVVRDCLCISEWNDTFFNVWIMKEYENKESWTKLYNIPYMKDHVLCSYNNVLYVSEDDQLLMKFYDLGNKKFKLVIYDSKNATWKIPEIQNIRYSKVYVESLISPCS